MGVVIGLTGGIATGKSTVADYLARSPGWPVVDADELARAAVAPPSPMLGAIADRYGSQMLTAAGTLDRAKLGEVVFADAQERAWLEAQIHPVVRSQLERAIGQWQLRGQDSGAAVPLVLAVPLWFEAGMDDLGDQTWVVWCDPDQQRDRLMHRNHLTVAQAEARIASQMPLAEKCDRADLILDNSGPLTALWTECDRAVQRVLG